MNANSTKRQYVPFGLRGTVVGSTNDKVIVLFDEQFFNGNNIYGLCEEFRGGYMEPNYLINLTKKFTKLQMHNPQVLETLNTYIKEHGGDPNQFQETQPVRQVI